MHIFTPTDSPEHSRIAILLEDVWLWYALPLASQGVPSAGSVGLPRFTYLTFDSV